LGLEVGYRLIPLVDSAADGELVRRIKGIRKKFAREIGFLPPAVHIRDNLEINPNSYRITLKGVEIGSGEVRTGLFLAIDPGNITASLPGVATRDPASACRRYGSNPACANRRRPWATPWSTPAPWSPPI